MNPLLFLLLELTPDDFSTNTVGFRHVSSSPESTFTGNIPHAVTECYNISINLISLYSYALLEISLSDQKSFSSLLEQSNALDSIEADSDQHSCGKENVFTENNCGHNTGNGEWFGGPSWAKIGVVRKKIDEGRSGG